jgi:hypothetical protein
MGSNTSPSWQAQALPEDEVAVEAATVEGNRGAAPVEPTAASGQQCSTSSGPGARSEQSKAIRLHTRRSWNSALMQDKKGRKQNV